VFPERLSEEFGARKRTNPSYSLRAFAVFLGADHSTLSQVLRGARRATVAQVRSWARKLAISPAEIAVYLAAEQVPDDATAGRHAMLRHWTAEAMAVVRDREHFEILRLCREEGFRADCRWIAEKAAVGVDEVNVALARLLRLGLIEMRADGAWLDRTGLAQLNEPGFRTLALGRVREKAAEDRVKFGKERTKRG
jgi:transcriptional regulator with XRE-family HTH domain